jgi:hypothetical protein
MADPAAQSGVPVVCPDDTPMAGCNCAGDVCYYPLFYCADDEPYPEYLTAAAVAGDCPPYADEDRTYEIDEENCVYYAGGTEGSLDPQDVFTGTSRQIYDCDQCGVFDLGPCECESDGETCNIIGVTFTLAGNTISPVCCLGGPHEAMKCNSPTIMAGTYNLGKHTGVGVLPSPPHTLPKTCFFYASKIVPAGAFTLWRSYGTPEDFNEEGDSDCSGNESFDSPAGLIQVALDIGGFGFAKMDVLLWSYTSTIWSETGNTDVHALPDGPIEPDPCDEPGTVVSIDRSGCGTNTGEPFMADVDFGLTSGTGTTTLILDCPGPP